MWLTPSTLWALIRNSRKTLGQELPEWTTLWDGRVIEAPRRIKWMIDAWRGREDLSQESDWAVAAYEGGDVIDVGAFHGWYPLLLAPRARSGDTFLLCEPDAERALPDLYANVAFLSRLYPHVRFAVMPLAIGDGSPVAAMIQPGNQAHPCWTSPDAVNSRPVSKSRRIDDLVSACGLEPRFLKIDVEGAEAEVIAGSLNTLAQFKPVLSLELHPQWIRPPSSQATIEADLTDLGYRMTRRNADAQSVRQMWVGDEDHG